jgi:hypothetical protein
VFARQQFRRLPDGATLRNILLVCAVGLVMGVLSLVHPALGFAAVIGVAAAYLSMIYPLLLGYVLIFFIITTSGINRGEIIPSLRLNEPILGLTGAVCFLVIMLRKPPRIADGFLTLSLVVLALGTSIGPIIAYYARGWRFTISELFSLVAPLQYMLLFWIFSYLPENDQDRRRLVQFMIFCASILAFVGLLQAARIGPVQAFLERWYGTAESQTAQAAELGRVTTLFGAWNATGTYLMIVILLLIALMAIRHPRLYKINMYVSLALCAACLLASGSFAGIGGLAAGVVIVKWLDRRGIRALGNLGIMLIIAGLILSPVIIQRLDYQFGDANTSTGSGILPQTFAYRLYLWSTYYIPALVQSNPWFGLYPTMENVSWPWAESQYIFLMMRSGIFSLIAHLIWVLMLCFWLWRKFKTTTGQTKLLALVTMTSVILLSVMGLTNEVFTLSGAIDYIWIFVGLIANAGVNPVAEPE